MGKLFGRKKRYSDEEYENEELFDDEELDEDDEEEIDDEDEEDEIEDDEAEDEEDEIEDDEDEDEKMEDDETEDVEVEDDDDETENEDDEIEDDDEDEEDEIEDDEDEEDDEEEEEEWDEEDRRAYRHRRRVRNQIIVYAVVFVFMAVVIGGCVFAGRSIIGVARQKKLEAEQLQLAEEQQRLQEEQEAQEVVIDAPEPVEEEPEEDYLGEIVAAYISEMPIEDKVAGLFIVEPEVLTGVSTVTQAGDGTREALDNCAIGGLIYFEKNIKDKEQITQMLSNTFSMSKYPIFLAIDEEGGSVSRVKKSGIDVEQVSDMAAIGQSGDAAQAYDAGTAIGTYLRELGFNLDFAPMADLADAATGELGDRVFGSDTQVVSDMISNMVNGIEGAGVSSCLKHFPGIGSAEGDTHSGRVETTKTLEEMRNYEFLPFKAGIDAGADLVMVSHITASAVDEEAVPSSLSRVIVTDVLRNELGFQGVIITDALNMGAITEYYTSEQAAVMAIEAGVDMLLMPQDFGAAYEAVLDAVQDGTISEERINESLERIYRLKCAEKLE